MIYKCETDGRDNHMANVTSHLKSSNPSTPHMLAILAGLAVDRAYKLQVLPIIRLPSPEWRLNWNPGCPVAPQAR